MDEEKYHEIEWEVGGKSEHIFLTPCPHNRINAFFRMPIRVGSDDCKGCSYNLHHKTTDMRDGHRYIKCKFGET